MAYKNKNRRHKKSHRTYRVNKRVSKKLPYSLSLSAPDNVWKFSCHRLLSLSFFYIFARRRKFQLLLGCFLRPVKHQLVRNSTLWIRFSPKTVACHSNRIHSQSVHTSFLVATIFRKIAIVLQFPFAFFCRPSTVPWALQDNNAVELANQSARYIG